MAPKKKGPGKQAAKQPSSPSRSPLSKSTTITTTTDGAAVKVVCKSANDRVVVYSFIRSYRNLPAFLSTDFRRAAMNASDVDAGIQIIQFGSLVNDNGDPIFIRDGSQIKQLGLIVSFNTEDEDEFVANRDEFGSKLATLYQQNTRPYKPNLPPITATFMRNLNDELLCLSEIVSSDDTADAVARIYYDHIGEGSFATAADEMIPIFFHNTDVTDGLRLVETAHQLIG